MIREIDEHRAADFVAGASLAPAGAGDYRGREDRLLAKIDQLAALGEGWDGESARTVDPLALRSTWQVLQGLMRSTLPEPELFPVPDGGVQIEWHAGPVEVELEIEPGSGAFVFVCDDEQSGQRIDGELPADTSRFALAMARLLAHR